MTPEEIKKDWEVIEAATKAPWDFCAVKEVLRAANPAMDHNQINDSHFISQARTRWPEALREVERLRTALEACQSYFVWNTKGPYGPSPKSEIELLNLLYEVLK